MIINPKKVYSDKNYQTFNHNGHVFSINYKTETVGVRFNNPLSQYSGEYDTTLIVGEQTPSYLVSMLGDMEDIAIFAEKKLKERRENDEQNK